MDQESVNEEFRHLAFVSVVEDAAAMIEQVFALEARSRHEMACNDDPEAAGRAAHEAYSLFMQGTTLAGLPTIVMGMADKFNREHEAYASLLDAVADAAEHLRQAVELAARNKPGLAEASILSARMILAGALEHALYEKDE